MPSHSGGRQCVGAAYANGRAGPIKGWALCHDALMHQATSAAAATNHATEVFRKSNKTPVQCRPVCARAADGRPTWEAEEALLGTLDQRARTSWPLDLRSLTSCSQTRTPAPQPHAILIALAIMAVTPQGTEECSRHLQVHVSLPPGPATAADDVAACATATAALRALRTASTTRKRLSRGDAALYCLRALSPLRGRRLWWPSECGAHVYTAVVPMSLSPMTFHGWQAHRFVAPVNQLSCPEVRDCGKGRWGGQRGGWDWDGGGARTERQGRGDGRCQIESR